MIPVPPSLLQIAARLDRPLYLVGGYVRNFLLYGKVLGTDIDVCGPFCVEELSDRLQGVAKVIPVNPRIGTVLLKVGEDEYEYTTFRKDSYPLGGAHTPQSVTFVQTVEEDALRRDFTVNALYYDIKNHILKDVLGGMEDLQNKRLRTADKWQKTFREDGLRLLRAVRFAAQLGFDLSPETEEGAKSEAKLLKDISPERKRQELDLIFTADEKYGVCGAHARGLLLLQKLGLWRYLLPEMQEYPFPSEEDVRIFERCPAPLRLTYLLFACLGKEDLYLTKARAFLGAAGLKYSNKKVEEVESVLYALNEIKTQSALNLYVAEHPAYAAALSALGDLCGNPLLATAQQTLARLYEKKVPFKVNALCVSGEQLRKNNVPPPLRGKALRYLLEESIVQERSFTPREQWEIVNAYIEKAQYGE